MTLVDTLGESYKYSGAGVTGERFTWTPNEFLTVEQSVKRSGIYWSSDVSLKALVELLNSKGAVSDTDRIDFVNRNRRTGEPVRNETEWAEFQRIVASGRRNISSANIESESYEIWWEGVSRAKQIVTPSMAISFLDRGLNPIAAEYVETTGTPAVKAYGRQAIISAMDSYKSL